LAKVILKNLTKVFPGGVEAVKRLNLDIEDGEFIVLVGPSGCGKTTTLRMIAGLEEVTEGEIYIGDRLVNNILPKDRDIAMVFQNYALYPHMTVYKNMAFGLMLRKFPKSEINKRVMEASEILNITHLLNRRPKALSGGERQRVAVGRAIVRNPKVFLFDEPLSNLDAKLRVQMRAELKKLHARLRTTMIYVTHDQTEAMTMGDRIVVMDKGVVQQVDTPLALYEKPRNRFTAGFIGAPGMNFIKGRIIAKGEHLYFDEGTFQLKVDDEMKPRLQSYLNKEVTFGIRPIHIHSKDFEGEVNLENSVKARVDVVEPMGSEKYVYFSTAKTSFISRVEPHVQMKVNEETEFVFDMSKAHFFSEETEEAIV
jgi:multiple sugar transport system ATP-binding protein